MPLDQSPVLCLSGGGFRATLFHLGALRRLNELGVLARIKVITSVSGGSILNGVLAIRWPELKCKSDGSLDGFDDVIARRIREFCQRDLRTPLLLGTRLNPANLPILLRDFFSVRANFLARGYKKLYGDQLLTSISSPQSAQTPRFVFCATSMQTGACWHFHAGTNGKMGDFYSGYVSTGCTTVADAVAASSAFPPGFSPLRLRICQPDSFNRIDPWGAERPLPKKRQEIPPKNKSVVFLTDGGVYDNLGVEPVWERFRCLLISDAGRPFSSQLKCKPAVIPRLARAASISMEQVGAVRKRWIVESLQNNTLTGALWTITTKVADYNLGGTFGYNDTSRALLASVRTDLNAFTEAEMNCLENHGYSLADAAIRARLSIACTNPTAPFRWPHPDYSADDVTCDTTRNSAKRRLLRDLWRYCRPCK